MNRSWTGRLVAALLLPVLALAACGTGGGGDEAGRKLLVETAQELDALRGRGAPPDEIEVFLEPKLPALRELFAGAWPTADEVGADGVSSLRLIVSFAAFDRAFQDDALARMRDTGTDAPRTEYASLRDEVAVQRGEPQPYGMAWRCVDGRLEPLTPIADPAGLDQRRAELRLTPIDEYLRSAYTGCGEPPEIG